MKGNKLTVHDLMVGDWVAIDEPDRYHGYNGQVVSIGGENRYVTLFVPIHNHDVFEEDLRPIPLTKDILEKNFEKKINYGIFDDYFDFEIREFNDGMFIANYHCCEFSLPDSQILGISYVHELQHVMRLFGIDKPIEI